MTTIHAELHTSRQFQGLILPAHPTSGTEDDDDDRDDEHAGENEAPVRAVDEGTETPEEDGDADEEEPEEEMAAPESAVAVPELRSSPTNTHSKKRWTSRRDKPTSNNGS